MELLKKCDFFPKVSENVELRTSRRGGLVFTFFLVIIILLSTIEIYSLFVPQTITSPYIEHPDINEKVRVNLNISIFDVPCEALTLDLQDITGSHIEDLKQTVYKLDLSKEGWIIDANNYAVVKRFENKNFYPSHPIWENWLSESEEADSCYGAELFKGQKCETCQDVMYAYRSRGWPILNPQLFKQCEGNMAMPIRRTLSEASVFNRSIKSHKFDKLIGDNPNKITLDSSAYLLEYLKDDHLFSFELLRHNCEQPQRAHIEFTYKDYKTNTTKISKSKTVFFPPSECEITIPLKIESIKASELLLQSALIENESIHIRVEEDELFKARVVTDLSDESSTNSNYSIFKRRNVEDIQGRMLHAEFYGFNDVAPRAISPDELRYFNNLLGKGCQIVGTMYVKKVPGNFHISTHHKGISLFHVQQPLTANHTVHLLEFTKEDGEITLGKYVATSNFLDGTRIQPLVAHDVQYYLKIVSSTFNHLLWGESTFYEYVAHVDVSPAQRNIVMLQFKLEFDPVSMYYVDRRQTFTKFFISLLAIIGGLFACSNLVDRIIEK